MDHDVLCAFVNSPIPLLATESHGRRNRGSWLVCPWIMVFGSHTVLRDRSMRGTPTQFVNLKNTPLPPLYVQGSRNTLRSRITGSFALLIAHEPSAALLLGKSVRL